ncbi:MAG: cellulase family glycosylhydrolase, partial [Maricaulaceae bacterium]
MVKTLHILLTAALITSTVTSVTHYAQKAETASVLIPTSNLHSISQTNASKSPINRCMNMSAMEAPNEGDWYNYKIRKSHLKAVSMAGFDTIRLPVRISAHTNKFPPYQIKPALLKRMDELVTWSIEYNLNIIIDVHNFYEINDNADTEEPRLDAIWDQLATHYAAAPSNVIFEFLNEPFGDMTNKRVDILNRRILKRIRRDNPNRWVIIGGAEWGTLHGLFRSNPPKDPKTIATFHYYNPFKYTHQGSNWTNPPIPMGAKWGSDKDKKKIMKDFQDAKNWSNENNIPLFLGEFGTHKVLQQGLSALGCMEHRGACGGDGI